jgi:hypothetical protein
MATMTADHLIEDYVRQLERAAERLPRDRREELVAEIREHIDDAVTQSGGDEVSIRNILERLGPPEAIVAEAAPPPAPAAPESRRLEIAALIALVVPFLGWIVGAVLVVISRAWTNREKALGLAILALVIVLPAFGYVSGGEESVQVPVGTPEDPPTESNPGPVELFFFVLLAGLPSALFLGWRLSLKRQTR